MKIGNHRLGIDPVFIIAELSANCRSLDAAIKSVHSAIGSGASAIKTQAYTADSMTLDSDDDLFQIKTGPWKGESLYSLYKRAAMPRHWHPILKAETEKLGGVYFATAFCREDVDFLEMIGVGIHKIASFEITDLDLIEYASSKKKPLIISTGMATMNEVENAACRVAINNTAFLHCVSAYPTKPSKMAMYRMDDLIKEYNFVGLSDHSLSNTPAIVAVVLLDACIIEKHFTLSRDNGSPDAAFSLEPHEFKKLVEDIRDCEAMLGIEDDEMTREEIDNLKFRRSIFAVADIRDGECFTRDNVRTLRPFVWSSLSCRSIITLVANRRANGDIKAGTPIELAHVV